MGIFIDQLCDERAHSEVEKGDLENSIFISMKNLLVALEDVKSNSTLDIELQINNLLSKICLLYEVDFKEKTKEIFDECDYEWIRWLELCDAPALCIKKIAEMYERDFWEIWDRVKRLIKRRATALYGNEEYNVLPISTEKFFKVVEDDMIAFWKDNDNFKFSKELCEWFEEIKKQLLDMSFPQQEKEYSLKYVMSLLKQMEDKYKVYVFSDFFEETIENLNDERYVKLWFICENLLNKVENEMPEDHKMRKRVLRRYMAVIGNKNLRQTLFGF